MPYMTRITTIMAAILASTGCVTGCGTAAGDERVTLKVLASASLTEAFQELGTAFHTRHEDVTVRFDFVGSLEAASRVDDHRPADVLATADRGSMAGVSDKVTGSRAFAYNAMTIAVAPGDPKHVRGLADLADPRVRVVIGGPNVPVGRYAARVLAKAGVAVRPRSEQADARAVLDRVRTGVADAGIVYVTDIRSAGVAAASVPIPARHNVTVTYYAAAVRRSGHAEAARDFVAWLGSAEAKTILRKYGFPTP